MRLRNAAVRSGIQAEESKLNDNDEPITPTQGISFGAEFGTASTWIAEQATGCR